MDGASAIIKKSIDEEYYAFTGNEAEKHLRKPVAISALHVKRVCSFGGMCCERGKREMERRRAKRSVYITGHSINNNDYYPPGILPRKRYGGPNKFPDVSYELVGIPAFAEKCFQKAFMQKGYSHIREGL